jgi:hypothetical protein
MITKANFEKYFIIFIFLGPPLGLGGGGGGGPHSQGGSALEYIYTI